MNNAERPTESEIQMEKAKEQMNYISYEELMKRRENEQRN